MMVLCVSLGAPSPLTSQFQTKRKRKQAGEARDISSNQRFGAEDDGHSSTSEEYIEEAAGFGRDSESRDSPKRVDEEDVGETGEEESEGHAGEEYEGDEEEGHDGTLVAVLRVEQAVTQLSKRVVSATCCCFTCELLF
jgi:hypothetical protein